jgi:cation diffusion facilitator CzcD-associated flavoprotein CzcO
MTERHRIAIIGAGLGGIATAIQLLRAGYDDFVVLEQAPGVGGTWYHNRYPGAECDVMSHLYSFSFEPNPDWSARYARQPEIRAYIERCVEKYGVTPYLRLSTVVRSATWDDVASVWCLDVGRGEPLIAEILVSALGMFNEPYWPDIDGIDRFEGRMFHSARWPDDVDLIGKRVGVIGSAASAIQLIPEVAEVAEQLYVFQRTATWVLPKDHRPYTDDDRARFRDHPTAMADLRAKLTDSVNAMMTFADAGFCAQQEAAGLENLAVVEDPLLREKLRPRMPWGSRRPIASCLYYPTFNRPNVELVTERIESITAEGLRTFDGSERPLDVLILATGFSATKYLSTIEVTGQRGQRLEDAWRDDPKAYLGVIAAGFPNLFILYGPNTNNGSILFMLECQADFVVRQVRLMDEKRLKWIAVRESVVENFNAELQTALDAVRVWQTDCGGYYRGRSGRIVTQWPHTMDEYCARLRATTLDQFEFERR